MPEGVAIRGSSSGKSLELGHRHCPTTRSGKFTLTAAPTQYCELQGPQFVSSSGSWLSHVLAAGRQAAGSTGPDAKPAKPYDPNRPPAAHRTGWKPGDTNQPVTKKKKQILTEDIWDLWRQKKDADKAKRRQAGVKGLTRHCPGYSVALPVAFPLCDSLFRPRASTHRPIL